MTHRKGFPAKCVLAVSAAVLILSATVHSAQEPIVFPSKGQSNEQMDSDKYACYSWAKGQTGFDPMQVPTATAPPPEAKGGLVKGAAGGALLGLAVGAVAGDAKKGAAIGGVSGGIVGGARKHQSDKDQQQYAQQQAAGYDQRRSEYNRAWSACMEGKGYTVR